MLVQHPKPSVSHVDDDDTPGLGSFCTATAHTSWGSDDMVETWSVCGSIKTDLDRSENLGEALRKKIHLPFSLLQE